MNISGAEIIVECLKEQGVKTVFGYPGGTALNLYDAIYKHSDEIEHILTSHEQGASHAADGYARATGRPGVCFATSGPGATNLVTGIATAYMDSVPLIAITCNVNVPMLGKDTFQEIDIAGVTMPITKHNFIVKDIKVLADTVRRAFKIATSGRPGPVLIDVAKDVTANTCAYTPKEPEKVKPVTDTISDKDIDKVLEYIGKSKKPYIFVGGGVIASGADKELLEFAEKMNAPVTDSLMGQGAFDENHKLYTGMLGMHGTKTSNFGVSKCDLLIVIGARFSDRDTGNTRSFAKNAKIVHIDIDPAEINKNVRVDYPVLGDLRWSLPLLRRKLDAMKNDFIGRFADWRAHTIEMNREKPFAYKSVEGAVMPEKVIEEVSRLADDDTIVVTDVGQHQMWAAQFYNSRRPRQFLTSGGLGTMGYGLPAALGAKLGKPEQQVVLFTGDGSIMMNCQEFATAADYDIDVKVIILHNHVLGMVAQWQRLFYNRHLSESRLNGHTDFVKLAEAMGVAALRVEKPEELSPALEKMLAHKGPMLLDVLVPEAEDVLPMVPGGKRLDQMVMGGTEE